MMVGMRLLAYIHVGGVLLELAILAGVCGLLTHLVVRRWINPGAKWYEWGLVGAIVGLLIALPWF